MALSPAYRLGFELRVTDDEVIATVETGLRRRSCRRGGPSDGDRIVAINGKSVNGETIGTTIRASEGKPVRLAVVRSRQKPCSSHRPRPGKSEPLGPSVAPRIAHYTWDVTKQIGGTVGRLVTGEGRKEISSPVGIVQGSSEALEEGASTYLTLLGLISLSLALLNLLPLLPLDGGHIAFSLVEGIRGKAVTREVYERVSAVGIAVVLLLFFIGLSNDIGRIGNFLIFFF